MTSYKTQNLPQSWRQQPKTPNTKLKFFLVSTTRLSEFLEGLNSSLAQSVGELWPLAKNYQGYQEAKLKLKVNFNNETCLLLPAQIPRSNVGQVAHVPPKPWVTSQEANITRRTPEAACWLRLERWSNNIANSHPSSGPFDCRVLRSCLVLHCSYPPYWPHHQWRLANCDCMPASYTSGQPSNPRRRPTCWASSQWSHTISRTPCHGVHRVQLHGPSNRDTHLYPPHSNSSASLTPTTYVRRSGRIINGTRSGRTTPQDSALNSRHRYRPPGMTLPKRAWVRLNRLRTGVGRFRSCLYKWGMASSAACECGAEEQTVDHVVLQCPIHRPPHGLQAGTDLGSAGP